MDVRLREGRPADAAECGAICYEAFKAISEDHGFTPEIPSPDIAVGNFVKWLSQPGWSVLVAEAGSRVVGSVVLEERSTIVGLGPMTVAPAAQDQAVGRQLMEAAIERVTEQERAGLRLLQSGYHMRSLSLYSKLGFEVQAPLVIIQGPPPKSKTEGRVVRPATVSDLEDCNDLCHRVHGHDRDAEVRECITQGTARIVQREGRITGYVTSHGLFGHAVAEGNEDMKALIGSAERFAGPGFILPVRNGELLRWCLNNGLRAVQPLTLMSMGLYKEPEGAFLPSIMY